MRKLTTILCLSSIGSIITSNSLAKTNDFSCDRGQNYCEIIAPRLTIGDQVGFFNTREELTALGKVDRIKGDERRVKISQQTGKLTRSTTYAMIEDEKVQNLEKNFTVYKAPESFIVGSDVGLGSVGVGQGGSGLVAGLGANYKVLDMVYVGGRLGFLSATGTAIDTYASERDEAEFHVQTLMMMPVVQFHLPNRGYWNVKSELGIGAASTKVNADETSSNNKRELLDRLSDGWGLGMRGSLGVYINESGWLPGIEASINQVQKTSFKAISVSLSHSL